MLPFTVDESTQVFSISYIVFFRNKKEFLCNSLSGDANNDYTYSCDRFLEAATFKTQPEALKAAVAYGNKIGYHDVIDLLTCVLVEKSRASYKPTKSVEYKLIT